MIFNEIDKANIVKNKINLEKRVEYVYSSGEGDSFDHKNRDDLGIDSPGTYGSEPVSGISSKNVKYVNSESLDGVHIGKLHIFAESIDTFGDDAVDEVFKTVNLDENYYNYRISNDKNKNYNFDVKRIKKKYLARDLDTEKIKSVKRIQEYYNTRHSKHNYKKMNWGFTNYNSLNMFTAGVFNDNVNEDSAYKQTHKNCLVYPNRPIDNKNQYDFSEIEEKTFSFYINPNQKNIQNHNGTIFGFNAGCILFIPDVISINIIKGSSRDGAGFVDKFRILVQLGSYSYDKIDYSDIESSPEKVSIRDGSLTYDHVKTAVSKDNILSFNNWHNVCITLKKVQDRNYIIQFFVDGNLTDTFLENIDFDYPRPEYITIGNKPSFVYFDNRFITGRYSQGTLNGIFVKKYFSQNLYGTDLEGSYSRKQISFGKENESLYSGGLLESIRDTERTFFDSSLYGRTDSENTLRNTNGESFAFHGEIHDIRILNIACDEILAKEIYENSVKEKNDSFDLEDLIFYVPFYYVPISVKKKGLVNLKKTGNDIELQDIAYSFPANPYYFNYAGGHETSVENFVVEFVKGASPNIVLEDTTTSDDYSILKLLSGNDLKEYSQKGLDPLEGCIKEASSNRDFWTLTNNKDLIYRNNMIFPNDNGIQEQNIEFALKHFFEETYRSKVFEEFTNYYNPTFVFTKNYIENNNFINKFFEEDFLRNDTLGQQSSTFMINPRVYIGKNQDLRLDQVDLFYANEDLKNNVLESYLIKDSFNRRLDPLWNSSNRNFHSEFYYSDDQDIGGYESDSDYMTYAIESNLFQDIRIRNTLLNREMYNFQTFEVQDNLRTKIIYNTSNLFLEVGDEFKFKTYSNPCARLYESEISLNSEDSKKIDTKNRLDGFGQENVAPINYYQYNMPLYVTDYDETNYDTVLFSISSQLVNKGIKKQTLEIKDVDLYGSGGKLKCTLKDNNFGQIYRSDCLTKVAKWNCIGNILYSEGFVNINHPGLYNFGFSNFKLSFESSTNIYTHELNIPAYSGQFNVSNNSSYIEDLRLDNSSFNLDEDFVYITDINIHDENLNVLAKARLARPFGKKNSDNVLFRLKMDY